METIERYGPLNRADYLEYRPYAFYVSQCIGILSLFLIICTNGCAYLDLAGAAAPVVSTGLDLFKLGKLDASVMANFNDCCNAANAGASDLGLRAVRQYKGGKTVQVWETTYEDETNYKSTIRVVRRTARLSQCRIDVGLFGSETTARLLMDRIRQHLPPESMIRTDAPSSR